MLAPTKNPLRMEEIESEALSDEPGLIYVHELQYSNGAVYRGQIKSVENLKKERGDNYRSHCNSRGSLVDRSLND